MQLSGGEDKRNALITFSENCDGKKHQDFKNDYKCMENMYFSDKEIDYYLKSTQYSIYRY